MLTLNDSATDYIPKVTLWLGNFTYVHLKSRLTYSEHTVVLCILLNCGINIGNIAFVDLLSCIMMH